MAARVRLLGLVLVACGGTPAPSPVASLAPRIEQPTPPPVPPSTPPTVDATPTTPASDARAVVMKDCAGRETLEPEPDALPPDLAIKPKLLVVYDPTSGSPLAGADRARLTAAVSKRLRTLVKLSQLTRKELAASEALVAQRRMTPNGPVCGQAPRLTQVLGAAHRHVVIASIGTYCFDLEGKDCMLLVPFKRAGTDDVEGLPETAAAPVTNDTPAAWIAAASRLELGVDTGGFRAMWGETRGVLEVQGLADDDPWLRLSDTLAETTEAKLAACVDAPASFEIQLDLSPAGTASVGALTPVTAPPAGTKVEACVREALAATPFPCTRDGQPAKATFRVCVAPATK